MHADRDARCQKKHTAEERPEIKRRRESGTGARRLIFYTPAAGLSVNLRPAHRGEAFVLADACTINAQLAKEVDQDLKFQPKFFECEHTIADHKHTIVGHSF